MSSFDEETSYSSARPAFPGAKKRNAEGRKVTRVKVTPQDAGAASESTNKVVIYLQSQPYTTKVVSNKETSTFSQSQSTKDGGIQNASTRVHSQPYTTKRVSTADQNKNFNSSLASDLYLKDVKAMKARPSKWTIKQKEGISLLKQGTVSINQEGEVVIGSTSENNNLTLSDSQDLKSRKTISEKSKRTKGVEKSKNSSSERISEAKSKEAEKARLFIGAGTPVALEDEWSQGESVEDNGSIVAENLTKIYGKFDGNAEKPSALNDTSIQERVQEAFESFDTVKKVKQARNKVQSRKFPTLRTGSMPSTNPNRTPFSENSRKVNERSQSRQADIVRRRVATPGTHSRKFIESKSRVL
eukprot:CAMPEP_0196589544 /NCGR_PEP_ID=MMETSP1081-20130531/63869_1 /TAXON_ID=36882 /ORGANISM="Pyramimonas amylifera, Strain CCMP720" /LENGTH=356 /DNA_ID=CAMNT_0041912383 /DNA_START=570 /DNA_END=1640 /DNA_ORIENTATION=-